LEYQGQFLINATFEPRIFFAALSNIERIAVPSSASPRIKLREYQG